MRLRSSVILKLLVLCDLLLCFATHLSFSFSLLAIESEPEVLLEVINATAASNASLARSNEDSFANMIDRALEREFPENEQNEGS